jgi:DNA-binding winged helix-turn-helix (wHTH) protein/TolB-like protein/Tfp pilus assembly protein PilF
MMNQQSEKSYEFGPFRLCAAKRLLLRDGQSVPVTSKSFDTLLMLVEHRGKVLLKDEMMKTLWPDTIVEENNLTQQISTLRKTLGERPHDHHYVVTIPGKGYSFVADVKYASDENSDSIMEQYTRSVITIDVEDECLKESSDSPERIENSFPVANVSSTSRWRVRTLIAALMIILIGIIAAFTFARREPKPEQIVASQMTKSIAVLPFRSLNADSQDDFLGSGMTDTLIEKLSNIRQVAVRPTSSTVKYAGQTPDAVAAGRELGVDSILEGNIQRAGDRMRVTVVLFNVSDGKSLWTKSFNEKLTDIFYVQDVIAEQVAEAMLVDFNKGEQERLRKRYTQNVDAYQLYLRGRHLWNKRDEESLKKSIEYFQQAIDIDPDYALAYAGIADAYNVIVHYGFDLSSSDESYQRARVAATKALEIDETLAEAHASLGLIKFNQDMDNAGAEREYKRAIELNPNYATAHHWYSDFLAFTGRTEESMVRIRRAQEIDPLSPIINATLGERFYYSHQYDDAIKQLQNTIEIEDNFFVAHFLLGLAYEQKGMYEQAITELQKSKELSKGGTMAVAALGHAYAVSGRVHEARKVLDELLKSDHPLPQEIAMIYLGLGEKEQAFSWIRKLEDKRAEWLLKTDPRLEGLRSYPGVQRPPVLYK